MKNIKLIAAALIVSVSSLSYAEGNRGQFNKNQGNRNLQVQALTAEEQNDLVYMREEEKLARDVYVILGEYFDIRIFNNIALAEQKHMNSVKRLLDKYSIEDPVLDDAIGIFTNEVFSEFYDNNTSPLVELKNAILTGILIEEVDIIDLQKAINKTNKTDIKNVYENLLRGSRNHLRAFVRQLESMGVVYESLVLDQAVADAIVNSPMERGSSNGKGRKGQGRR
ncbi:MAG: DUF2202 domain-containing protein [Methylococcaceae bacterium]|nr:DUF2202 domain-containing protein [Methylococcaceae bacterium]